MQSKEEHLTYIRRGLLLLTGLVLVLMLLNLLAGSTGLTAGEVVMALKQKDAADAAARIVWQIRLPRLLSAALMGGALGVSGFLLQTFFANPIAGPYVLGVSSGAKLMVALAMIYGLSHGLLLNAAAMITVAFCGALLVLGLILAVSGRVKNMGYLIVCGVMVGYICSAITNILVTFADDANIVNLHNWSMGSFAGIGWEGVKVSAITILATLAASFGLAKPMHAYQLGEAYAGSMGVNIPRFRVGLLFLASLLAACVTAFAGPVSFVGVAVPHLMKILLRSIRPLFMLPACFLGGSAFCLFCDLLARSLFAPAELNISSVTAVFGAPVVIGMLFSRQRNREGRRRR